jgi:hypothetical protein
MADRFKVLLTLRFTEGQVWSVHELFGYMELSILALVTGEPSIYKFPSRPWEGISPREDIESVFPRPLLDQFINTLSP